MIVASRYLLYEPNVRSCEIGEERRRRKEEKEDESRRCYKRYPVAYDTSIIGPHPCFLFLFFRGPILDPLLPLHPTPSNPTNRVLTCNNTLTFIHSFITDHQSLHAFTLLPPSHFNHLQSQLDNWCVGFFELFFLSSGDEVSLGEKRKERFYAD